METLRLSLLILQGTLLIIQIIFQIPSLVILILIIAIVALATYIMEVE